MRKLIVVLATLASVAGLAFAVGGTAQAKGPAEGSGQFAGQAQAASPTAGQAHNVAASRPTFYRCPYLALCTYTGANFTGEMHIMKNCREYSIEHYNFYSWINNQSAGTRAVFRGSHHEPIFTTGLPLSYQTYSGSLGEFTYFAKPCRN